MQFKVLFTIVMILCLAGIVTTTSKVSVSDTFYSVKSFESVETENCTDLGSDGILDNTITVDKSGNCTVIHRAVNNATAGATIILRDGYYTGKVKINKQLTVRSENGSANCTVYSNGDVFIITADHVNVSGFTIKGPGVLPHRYTAGFRVYSHYCNLTDNMISDNMVGIYLEEKSNNNTIKNNIFSNNRVGVYLWYSDNNNIENNIAYKNEEFGIQTTNSCYNMITNNTAKNHSDYHGILLQASHHSIVAGNRACQNKYGLYMVNSYKNFLLGNNFTNNYAGIGIDSALSSNNLNNCIYLNNFIDNNNNIVYFSNTNNIWNSTEKIVYTYPRQYSSDGLYYEKYLGNYWDDYSDADKDGGVWTKPYNVSEGQKDYCPLVERFEKYSLLEFDTYDTDENCVIDTEEVFTAIEDCFNGDLSSVRMFEVVDSWYSGAGCRSLHFKDLINDFC